MVEKSFDEIVAQLAELFPDREGFEFHPFKIGSYNNVVGPLFQLSYNEQTLGVVLVSTPSFFETTFKSWLISRKNPDESLEEFASKFDHGPIDTFFDEKFQLLREAFDPLKIEIVRDNDVLPNRRPKILMTTSGHVAGAAFLYHPPELAIGAFDSAVLRKIQKRRSGVCLHPKYGGYFAFRGVLLFPEILVPENFKEKRAPMILNTIEKQDEAVELYNSHWHEGTYRDCGNPVEKYSPLQLKYFNTLPAKRWPLIADWFEK